MRLDLLLTACLGLGGPPADWEPVAPPPPTPWARAGARAWSRCLELQRDAEAVRSGSHPASRRHRRTKQAWPDRALECPRVPVVLLLAAQSKVIDTGTRTLSTRTEQDVAVLVEQHEHKLQQALEWLDTALAEADRRREPPPKGVRYFRAHVLVGLGRLQAARDQLTTAIAMGDTQRWRADRTRATIELLAGNLSEALRFAHRGLRDAPVSDTTQIVISRYVLAFVLDRVGAPQQSRELLTELRDQYRHTQPSPALEYLLPIHERLYLRALFHQAAGNVGNARRLWGLYLARPEPAEPERRLALRHRKELAPPPVPVGGPMGP